MGSHRKYSAHPMYKKLHDIKVLGVLEESRETQNRKCSEFRIHSFQLIQVKCRIFKYFHKIASERVIVFDSVTKSWQ